MATRIGDLAIVISANVGGLARDLARGDGMVRSFAGGITRQLADAGRAIGDIGRGIADLASMAGFDLGGGLKEMVKSSIDLAKAAEVSAMKFEVLTGSIEKARDLMKDLRDFAAASPVSQADAFQHGASLLGVGVEQRQIAPTLNRLSEVSMGDPETLKSWVRVYGQIKAMGRLTGSDYLQIANTNSLNYSHLAAVMKHDTGRQVQTEEVRGLIEKGRVGFYDLQMAIKKATEAGGDFFGMNEKYAQTYAGKLDKLKDSWDEFQRDIGTSLVEGLNLKGLADDVGQAVDRGKQLASVVKDLAATAKTLAGYLADSTSWLYRMSQHAAAATLGDFSSIGGGRQARANTSWETERTGQLRKQYGIGVGDSYDLLRFQEIYQEARGAAEKAARDYETQRRRHAEQPALDALAAQKESHLQTMQAAADRSAEIVKRGDPSKVTMTLDGKAFVPAKPPLDPRLTELASKLNDSLVNPAKKLADDLADLRKIADAGRLDPDVLERATLDLVSGAAKEAGLGTNRLAPAAELGSSQLANIVAGATQGTGPQSVEGLLKQLADINRQQLDAARQIVAGVSGKPPVIDFIGK